MTTKYYIKTICKHAYIANHESSKKFKLPDFAVLCIPPWCGPLVLLDR